MPSAAKEQRVLQGFGIGEAEWKALKGVEWSKVEEAGPICSRPTP